MKAIDIVKPTERTEFDSDLVAPPIGFGSKRIEIKGESEADAITRRTEDWPEHDPNPVNCKGKGHAICMQQGEHSWFNHAQDSMTPAYPPEFSRSFDE